MPYTPPPSPESAPSMPSSLSSSVSLQTVNLSTSPTQSQLPSPTSQVASFTSLPSSAPAFRYGHSGACISPVPNFGASPAAASAAASTHGSATSTPYCPPRNLEHEFSSPMGSVSARATDIFGIGEFPLLPPVTRPGSPHQAALLSSSLSGSLLSASGSSMNSSVAAQLTQAEPKTSDPQKSLVIGK